MPSYRASRYSRSFEEAGPAQSLWRVQPALSTGLRDIGSSRGRKLEERLEAKATMMISYLLPARAILESPTVSAPPEMMSSQRRG